MSFLGKISRFYIYSISKVKPRLFTTFQPQNKWKSPKASCTYTNKRTFFDLFRPHTSNYYRKVDGVPEDFTLIYRNKMWKYLSLTSMVLGFTTFGVCFAYIMKEDEKAPIDSWSGRTGQVKNEEIIYLTLFTTIAIAAQVLILRIPLRIYKITSANSYCMICNGIVPFSTKKVVFDQGKIEKLAESGILPWSKDRYLVRTDRDTKSIILLENYFRTPADLNIMLREYSE